LRHSSLFLQILLINSLLVTATVGVLSVATGGSLEPDVDRPQYPVFVLALLGTLMANALLLRRRLEPLDRLVATTSQVDLSAPGLRAVESPTDLREVARLTGAFNRMLARLESERRHAGSAVLEAQERERERLARELHDEVNQALTALLLRLAAAREAAPPGLRAELGEVRDLAAGAMGELRTLARQLRPAALDDLGLTAALDAHVRDFARHTGLRTSLELEGEAAAALSPDQQLVVYRVAQESLSNVARHAGAASVDVSLSGDGAVCLRVADDGRGFAAEPSEGLGVTGMRARALAAGGRLEVGAGARGGTTVELRLEAPA
jgi:two-component system, NarL family, sensor histidine kinase UhpB